MKLSDMLLGNLLKKKGSIILYAPLQGRWLALEKVKDAAFSQGMLGKGIAVVPSQGVVVAPCQGLVTVLPETGHAVGLQHPSGAEILIHVGLDTVKLAGQGFEPQVRPGDTVETGQVLLRFDLTALQAAGYDTTTPVVVCNADSIGTLDIIPHDRLNHSDQIIRIRQ